MSNQQRWEVILHRRLRREIRRLPKATIANIMEAIYALADEPRPPGCKKLTGLDHWRIVVDNYRVVYDIHDDILEIHTIRVAHRREVYRNL